MAVEGESDPVTVRSTTLVKAGAAASSAEAVCIGSSVQWIPRLPREAACPSCAGFWTPAMMRCLAWPSSSVRRDTAIFPESEAERMSRGGEENGARDPYRSLLTLTLEKRVIGAYETKGPSQLVEFAVITGSDCGEDRGREKLGREERELGREELGRLDWADWGPNGDLLFAREGELFRAKLDAKEDHLVPKLVMDFRSLKFTREPPTDDALKIELTGF
jgi:hypothetical protein